jgi:flagellar biosynthesis protein FlhB
MLMQIQILSRWKNWKKAWQAQDLTDRLVELLQQALDYFLITLVMAGAAGAVAQLVLPAALVHPVIYFLALVYLLLLLIAVAHSFETNRTRYQLAKIEEIQDELREFEMKQGCR